MTQHLICHDVIVSKKIYGWFSHEKEWNKSDISNSKNFKVREDINTESIVTQDERGNNNRTKRG